MKKLVIAGASGAIGSALAAQAVGLGYEVVGLSRTPRPSGKVRWVTWTLSAKDAWAQEIEGAAAVINLTGASVIGKRWSPSYKKELLESRLKTTSVLVEAMKLAKSKPAVFINGSAVGIYGDQGPLWLDEEAPAGKDFLAGLAGAWESLAMTAEKSGIRTVVLRTGVVLDSASGALASLLTPFRLFAGGPVLPGTQYVPWIHVEDETGLIFHAIDNPSVSGPLNAAAPEPVPFKEFASVLGRVLGRPSWLPVPAFALRILLGEAAVILTASQRVRPAKALGTGYSFRFSSLEPALRDLLKQPA